MSGGGSYIPQDCWFSVKIIDNQVKATVGIQVAHRQPSAGPGARQRTTRSRANSFKFSVLEIVEQQRLLGKTGSPLVGIHCRVDVSVYNEEIQPPVVVVVDEARAPAEKRNSRFTKAGLKSYIGEIPFTIVVIENVGVVRKICNVKIYLAVVIIISDG